MSTLLNEDDLRYVRLERNVYGWGIASLALMVVDVALSVLVPSLDGSLLLWGIFLASWACLGAATYCAYAMEEMS